MAKNEHRELILELVKLFRPRVYVEIGVQYGYTFNLVSSMDGIELAIGIDPAMSHVKSRPNVWLMHTTSAEAAKIWTQPIDMLFIDGNHEYNSVKQDFMTYSKFVIPGTGLILMHDTYPIDESWCQPSRCFSAWLAADDIYLQKNKFEIVTLPGPTCGLSIVRKRGPMGCHLTWREKL